MTTYNIYRNGNKIADGLMSKSYTDKNLTPNTEYTYQVSSEGVAGESELSEPLTIKTKYSSPAAIEVSPKTNNLEAGATRNLTAIVLPDTAKQTVTWSSSDDAVATVDNNGKVTAIGAGTTTVTATSTEDSSINDTATVNVTEPVPPENGD